MNAKYILAALALIFLTAALRRLARGRGQINAESRTWLLIALIFGLVSAYLFLDQ